MAEGKQQILGLKFIDQYVRFVDLDHLDGRHRLLNCGEGQLFEPVNTEILLDLGERYKIADALTSILESQEVETRQVVTAIDSQLAIVRRIPLEDNLTGEELSDYIQWQAQQHIIAPLDKYTIDFQLIGPEGKEAILVAAQKVVVDAYKQLLEAAGLIPMVIDVDCFAMCNAFELNYHPCGLETVALINVEPNRTDIVVLRSGEFYWQESLGWQWGGDSVPSSSANQAEGLQEVSWAVISRKLNEVPFLAGGLAGYDKIFLGGSGSSDSRLAQYLGFEHNCAVETVNPFLEIQTDPSLSAREGFSREVPKYFICLGLAIRTG